MLALASLFAEAPDVNLAGHVGGGELHTCVAMQDGSVWCMGVNDDGEVGNGSVSLGGVITPVRVDICGSDLLEAGTCPR